MDPAKLELADNHVHSEWSWDATHGDMNATCARAVELGLRSIAFTEHADFVFGEQGTFDPAAYLESIAKCRASYPGLRILSGVELGEPHRHKDETRAMLLSGFDRVLASVHGVEWNGRFTDASERGFLTVDNADAFFREYLTEVELLLSSDAEFAVLAHLDYPKRYVPEGTLAPETYEAEFRSILRATAKRGVVLEINTTRGREPVRGLCPGLEVVKWWREEGGQAVSLGSDAHRAEDLAKGLEMAREVAEAAGFARVDDATGFWLR